MMRGIGSNSADLQPVPNGTLKPNLGGPTARSIGSDSGQV